MRSRSILYLFLLPILSFFLASCLKVEQHYVLNPSGSGKVMVKADITEWGISEDDEDLTKELRDKVKEYMENAEGIDAWNDVKYSFVDGKVHFEGTAYFSDLNAVESKDLALGNLKMSQTPVGDKRVSLDMKTNADASMSASSTETGEREPTEEEIQHQIDSLKESFSMVKGMMEMVLKDVNVTTAVRAPGGVRDITGFQSKGNEFSYVFEGQKMLDIMDKAMTDTAFIREQIRRKQAGDTGDPMQELMFPNGKPSLLIPVSAADIFNYDAEVASARRDQEKIMKELNSAPKKSTKKKKTKKT